MSAQPICEIDKKTFYELLTHGVLKPIKTVHFGNPEEGKIVLGCGDGNRLLKVLRFYLEQLGITLDIAKIHLMTPTGGAFTLNKDCPLVKKHPGVDEYWLNEIKFVVEQLKFFTITLHVHKPCARGQEFGYDLYATVDALFRAKNRLRAFLEMETVHSVTIIPLIDIHHEHGIKTYYGDKKAWTEFVNAGMCELPNNSSNSASA